MFGLSFEEKVNKAVEGLAAHGIHDASCKIDDKVVTLSGMAHDVAAKTRAVIWFNEQVNTDNTINMIQVEVPNKAGGQPVPGAKPASPAFPGVVSGSSSSTSGTAATAPHVERAGGPALDRVHVVAKGDTLSDLSKKYYGRASDYMKIYNANTDLLKDPDKIYPGQRLKIPQ